MSQEEADQSNQIENITPPPQDDSQDEPLDITYDPNYQQTPHFSDSEERRAFEAWNAEHGYGEDDFIEFDFDDVRFTDDGYVDVNLDNYPHVRDAMGGEYGGDYDGDYDGEDEDVDLLDDDTVHLLRAHQDAVISVKFSPADSTVLASGGCDEVGFLYQLNEEDNAPVQLEGHSDSVMVSFSNDGKYLATAGLDAVIKIWNPETGELLHTLEGASESIESISWFSKGPLLVAGSGDNLIWLWNAQSGAMMGLFAGHDGPIVSTMFSADNKKIISASSNSLKIWNPKDSTSPILSFNESNLNFHQGEDEIVTMASHYENNIVITGGLECLAMTNIDTGKVLFKRPVDQGVESICFNKQFPVFATGSLSGAVKIWDAAQLQERLEVRHDDGVVKVAHVPESILIASSSLDKTSRIWDPRSGEEVMKFQGHTGEILDMDISHDGLYLASSGEDCTVRVFDLRTESEL
eukprot:TRINITY_DN7917_c0_g1_i1.p1 TRINITY_DN7917_c0_g1~~TRINITY_DN7917_c0_g1_i1.p1  ORF type:complete len:480 (-),score=140.94 TRINITY_DN7917_c0_g1_i1:90-1481(-)